MALVTFQIVEGLERGRIFSDLPTPVTIGREEDNTISLKDEQVSRLHAKLQDEEDRVILTDVSSTNGTRVQEKRCTSDWLMPGDEISIANYRYTICYSPPPDLPPHLRGRLERLQLLDGVEFAHDILLSRLFLRPIDGRPNR